MAIIPLLDKGSMKLESLNLSCNHISSSTFSKLSEKITTVREPVNLRLFLGNNAIGHRTSATLLKACCSNKNLAGLKVLLANEANNSVNVNRVDESFVQLFLNSVPF